MFLNQNIHDGDHSWKNYWWPLFLVRQIFHEIMCVFDRIQYERKEIKII